MRILYVIALLDIFVIFVKYHYDIPNKVIYLSQRFSFKGLVSFSICVCNSQYDISIVAEVESVEYNFSDEYNSFNYLCRRYICSVFDNLLNPCKC